MFYSDQSDLQERGIVRDSLEHRPESAQKRKQMK